MTTPTFTKEQLEEIAMVVKRDLDNVIIDPFKFRWKWSDLAAFALAQTERAERAEIGIALCIETIKALRCEPPGQITPTEAASAWATEYVKRRERAERAERRATDSEGVVADLLGSVQRIGAERDRLAKGLEEAEEAILGLSSWFITKTVTCSEPECPACNAMRSPAVLRARERGKANP